MVTTDFKKRVVTELLRRKELFAGSDAKFATSLGINGAAFSRIKNGDLEKVLADSVWISLGRKMEVTVREKMAWNIVKTPVFVYITAQLELCQRESVSGMIVDLPDIGKTETAKQYARTHKNAVYVDCSQVKSKQKLIRYIAKEFGVDFGGKYFHVYDDLVYYIRSIDKPLVILDEAGDLNYDAFLELKALWNATEMCCGWYQLGADGLKEKMRRGIDNKKVGYTEIFSRFGKRYGRVTPEGKQDSEQFLRQTASMIIKANAPETDVQIMLAKTDSSLRRIKTEIGKQTVKGE